MHGSPHRCYYNAESLVTPANVSTNNIRRFPEGIQLGCCMSAGGRSCLHYNTDLVVHPNLADACSSSCRNQCQTEFCSACTMHPLFPFLSGWKEEALAFIHDPSVSPVLYLAKWLRLGCANPVS